METKITSLEKKYFDCNSLTNKSIIYSIAQSIINNKQNKNIWNLSDIDTAKFFTIEDYFTNAKTKNRIVYVGGEAGMSSGSANNLLILFECNDTFKIIWSGQVGDISQSDIKDLNGDGIKEIVATSGTVWMGECDDDYIIFNFKGDSQNKVYETLSSTMIDCGLHFDHESNLNEIDSVLKTGDTLETMYGNTLFEKGSKFYVKQAATIKIDEGGNTDKEILKKMKVINDTAIIPIN